MKPCGEEDPAISADAVGTQRRPSSLYAFLGWAKKRSTCANKLTSDLHPAEEPHLALGTEPSREEDPAINADAVGMQRRAGPLYARLGGIAKGSAYTIEVPPNLRPT